MRKLTRSATAHVIGVFGAWLTMLGAAGYFNVVSLSHAPVRMAGLVMQWNDFAVAVGLGLLIGCAVSPRQKSARQMAAEYRESAKPEVASE